MLLSTIICVPLAVGLICLLARPRAVAERLNIAGFVCVLFLGVKLLRTLLAANGAAVTECAEFLRADALSAWMVLLVAVVSLAASLYAVRYFRRDLADGVVNERRFRQFYVLTPLFATGMFLVVLANNLGVMWIAVEATALSSVLLVALYNRKTSLEDAHSEAPSPTSAMLSGVSLKIALYALLRFHILASACLGTGFSRNLLLGFGLFSMLLAGPFILVQKNLKRLLAYSSLEHVGLICVAVGMNARLTIFGALLHMGYHALTKPVLFFAAGNIHQHFHTLEFRDIGSGLVRTMPVTALLLALAAVAVSGLPPFGLFMSELTVIAGGFTCQHTWVSVVVLSSLIMVFCGVLNKLAGLLLGPSSGEHPREIISASTLVALLVFTAWLPPSVRQLMEQAAGVIQGMP